MNSFIKLAVLLGVFECTFFPAKWIHRRILGKCLILLCGCGIGRSGHVKQVSCVAIEECIVCRQGYRHFCIFGDIRLTVWILLRGSSPVKPPCWIIQGLVFESDKWNGPGEVHLGDVEHHTFKDIQWCIPPSRCLWIGRHHHMSICFKIVFSGPSIQVNSNWVRVLTIKPVFKICESELYFIWLDSIYDRFQSFGFLESAVWNCWLWRFGIISLLYFIMKSLDSLNIICSISQD